MTGPQRVGEIVKVLDGLSVEFGEDIAGLEARFVGGRTRPDIREPYSIGYSVKSGMLPKSGP
jgi:hypothetical protein